MSTVAQSVQLRRVARARRRSLQALDAYVSEVRAARDAGCSIRSIAAAAGANFETTRKLVANIDADRAGS